MGHERTVLPSGIRVVTERLDGQRSLTVGAWVATGSRHEPDELAGATHFLEHLVFKGTPTRTARGIAEAFDAVGGDINAFTTKELTCFHARTLPEDAALCVETIADLIQNATLTSADLEAERTVVLEEIAMQEDSPEDAISDQFFASLWPGHGLGRRIEGSAETVAAMQRDAIDGYYRARYAPGSIVVSASGAVDHAALVSLVDASFAGGHRLVGDPTDPPVPVGSLTVVEDDLEQVHLTYGTPGVARGDERRWAVWVLNAVLGGGMSSRLFQEIREERGLAYNVGSGHQSYADAGALTVYAACAPKRAPEVLAVVRGILDDIVGHGVGDEEFARAVGHLRGALLLSLDEPGAQMSHLGKSELLTDRILSTEEMIARVGAVTLDDVRAVATDIVGSGPWTLAVRGPAVAGDMSTYVGEAA